MSALSKILKDKVYDELDDLSKFLYPWTGAFFEEIAQLKDVVITRADVEKAIDTGTSIRPFSKCKTLCEWGCPANIIRITHGTPLPHDTILPDNMKPDDIVATFPKQELSDEVYLYISTTAVHDRMNLALWCGSFENGNAKELISIFQPRNWAESTGSRGRYAKQQQYAAIIVHLLKERKLKIRDSDLLMKLVTWSTEFNNMGNKAALANLLKIKISMHEDQVIYSIEEAT